MGSAGPGSRPSRWPRSDPSQRRRRPSTVSSPPSCPRSTRSPPSRGPSPSISPGGPSAAGLGPRRPRRANECRASRRASRGWGPAVRGEQSEKEAVMAHVTFRPRRLREKPLLRRMVRETALSVDDLVYPLFVVHGRGVREPIGSMPGQFRLSIDELVKDMKDVASMGIPGVLLFGPPTEKDPRGSEAYAEDGIVQQAVRAVKDVVPDLLVLTDVCLCQYTSHGHCGIVEGGTVRNDPTLELLARVAVSHAEAGADMVAPSDM